MGNIIKPIKTMKKTIKINKNQEIKKKTFCFFLILKKIVVFQKLSGLYFLRYIAMLLDSDPLQPRKEPWLKKNNENMLR